MGLDLRGTVSLDGSGFEKGIQAMEHSVKHLVAGAFGLAAIEQALHHTIEYGDHMVDMARRTGVGIQALQELGYAAKQNGADLEELVGFIEKLNSSRIDPNKWGSFSKLGIGASDLSGLKAEDLLMKISANIQNRSSQEVVGPLRDIGGKGAGAMIATIKDDLPEVIEQAHKLGLIMKNEDAVMLKFLTDEFVTLAQAITVGLAPAIVGLEDLILHFVNAIKGAGAFLGTFIGGGGGKAIASYFGMPGVNSTFGEMADKVGKAWTESGDAMAVEFTELEDATAKLKAGLMERQNRIEGINAIPDFGSVIGGESTKAKGNGRSVYSDNLTRIGNFLASARDPIERYGREHSNLLKKIEKNTRPKFADSNGFDSQFPVS